MEQDPFGNLMDWGHVLAILDEISGNGRLADCQPGLIRILRYKSNWRLREEALKRIPKIRTPSRQLVLQVLDLLGNDNLYYDARVLAANALGELLKNVQADSRDELTMAANILVKKLKSTPQPSFFDSALETLHRQGAAHRVLEN